MVGRDLDVVGVTHEKTLQAADALVERRERHQARLDIESEVGHGSTFSVANWIDWWRAEGWDAPNVAINLGNNDVGFCGADLACNAENVRYLLDAIGPGHTVWWSRITRLFTQQADADAFNLGAGYQHSFTKNVYGKVEYRHFFLNGTDFNAAGVGLGVKF